MNNKQGKTINSIKEGGQTFTAVTNKMVEILTMHELYIMTQILYNSEDKWILVKRVIQQRCINHGMGRDAFNSAWKELMRLHYLSKDGKYKHGYKWTINCNPYISNKELLVRNAPQELLRVSTKPLESTNLSNTTLSILDKQKEEQKEYSSTIELKGQSRTNTISIADAIDSILDGANAPDLSTKADLVYNIQYSELDMPSIDFNSSIEPL